MTDNSELPEHQSRLERATESTLAKAVNRFFVPGLLTLISWFVVDGVTSLREDLSAQGKDIVQIKSDVRNVNTRLDAQVLSQVERNTKAIDNLDTRLQRIERRLGDTRD